MRRLTALLVPLMLLASACGEPAPGRTSRMLDPPDASTRVDGDSDATSPPDVPPAPDATLDALVPPPPPPPPRMDLYGACVTDDHCSDGLTCTSIGTALGAPHGICTVTDCHHVGDQEDPRCLTGGCFDFGDVSVCVDLCSRDEDCGAWQACNRLNGACFSTCTADADCDQGFTCDASAREDRRLCIPR